VLPLMRAVARLMPGPSAPLETLNLNVEIMRAQAGM
jgi:hypothetical protein